MVAIFKTVFVFQGFLLPLAGAGMGVIPWHLSPIEAPCISGRFQGQTGGSQYTERPIAFCQTFVCLGGIHRRREKSCLDTRMEACLFFSLVRTHLYKVVSRT